MPFKTQEDGRSYRRKFDRLKHMKSYGVDAEYTLEKKLRTKLRAALRLHCPAFKGDAPAIVGCTVRQLKIYLDQDIPGFDWATLGGWDIAPRANTTGWHYTNLTLIKKPTAKRNRPLTEEEKRQKNEYERKRRLLPQNREHILKITRIARKRRWATRTEAQKVRYRELAKRTHQRMRQDPGYVIKRRLRRRLHTVLRVMRADKLVSSLDGIGCTVAQLRQHLESTFTTGMSWSVLDRLVVDHIRPVCSFNVFEPAEQLKCNHYTNLRMAWPIDNLKKSREDKLLSIRARPYRAA